MGRRGWAIVGGAALLTIVARWWWSLGQPLSAFPSLRIDDALFVRSAEALRAGEWLGRYDQLTLAKHPGYPMFIAFAGTFGVRLLLAQLLLGCFVAALSVVAVRHLVGAPWRRAALFAALVLHPMAFHTAVVARVDRSGIYPSLLLGLVVSLVGFIARDRRTLERSAWAASAAAFLAAAWVTREEALLLVPPVVVAVAIVVTRTLHTLRAGPRPPLRPAVVTLAAAVTPVLLLVALPIVAVALIDARNDEHYGARTVNEVHDGAFADAFAALLSVDDPDAVARFPLSSGARARIAAASPAFASLIPWIDGPEGMRWRFPRPDGTSDIPGFALQWVLRDAAASIGVHDTAPGADDWYRELAAEVDDACDGGELSCGRDGRGLLPPATPQRITAAARRFVRGLWDTAVPRRIELLSPAGDGTPAERAVFAAATGERVLPEPVPQVPGPLRRWSLRALVFAGRWGLLVALAAGVVRVVRHRERDLIAALAVPVAAVVARVAALAYVDVTMYPGFDPPYVAPAYVLVVFAAAVAVLAEPAGVPAAGTPGPATVPE